MKAVLSNRIFMDANLELREKLSKELTYVIPAQNPNDPPQIIKNLQRVRDNLVAIPSGREDLIPNGYEVVDKRVVVPADFPEFKYVLRESQQAVYDELDDSSIINAWVSWGKTFTGLALAGKLSQKTLVITHTVPLRNQWAKEVEKYMESPLELLVVVISIPIVVLWLVIPKHSTETSIEFEKCLEQLSWTKCITYLRQLFQRSSTPVTHDTKSD